MHIKPQPQQLLILLSKNSVRICETLNKEKFLCCFVKENLMGNFFSLKFCKHWIQSVFSVWWPIVVFVLFDNFPLFQYF